MLEFLRKKGWFIKKKCKRLSDFPYLGNLLVKIEDYGIYTVEAFSVRSLKRLGLAKPIQKSMVNDLSPYPYLEANFQNILKYFEGYSFEGIDRQDAHILKSYIGNLRYMNVNGFMLYDRHFRDDSDPEWEKQEQNTLDVLNRLLEIPLNDVPLHINDSHPMVRVVGEWRLKGYQVIKPVGVGNVG